MVPMLMDACSLPVQVDGNAHGNPTPIFLAPLSDNPLRVTGVPVELIRESLAWEGPLVEGPWMIRRNGEYFLFYSGNGFSSPRYAIAVARAPHVSGPFTKRGDPILHGEGFPSPPPRGHWEGPGHCSVVGVGGSNESFAFVYHAFVNGSAATRYMLLDQVTWGDDGWPGAARNGTPSEGPTPIPS